MNVTKMIRKKPNRFLQLLMEQAELTHQGLGVLLQYVQNPQQELADRIRALEKDADEVRRILIEELNQTFVTPFDREDIFSLSRAIDDVIDYADTTVSEMDTLGAVSYTHLRAHET